MEILDNLLLIFLSPASLSSSAFVPQRVSKALTLTPGGNFSITLSSRLRSLPAVAATSVESKRARVMLAIILRRLRLDLTLCDAIYCIYRNKKSVLTKKMKYRAHAVPLFAFFCARSALPLVSLFMLKLPPHASSSWERH